MAYNNKYKQQVLKIYHNRNNNKFKINIEQILYIYNIARSTLYEWIKNKNDIMNDVKKKRKKIYKKLNDNIIQYICNYIDEYKQFKIKKLKKCIQKKFKISISKQSIYDVLKNNNYTYKKTKENHYPYDNEKLKKEINNVKDNLGSVNYDTISIDETAFYLNTKASYGWSKKGSECEIKSLMKLTKYSMCTAISNNKVIHCTIKKGNFNAKSFNNFMRRVDKKNKENKKYFLDNARIHHALLIDNNIKNKFIFNVPYFSKFNPIEMYFNTQKRYLANNNVTSIYKLKRLVNIFSNNITSIELAKYFNKAFNMLLNFTF